MFAIVEEELDVGALIQAAQRPDCGAIATFVGTTRIDESEGAAVRHVSIVHRLGRVDPGEASVAIVVAAPRRGPAFEASRYAIERIKEVVPIWKREVWSDGYVWVGSQVGTRDQVSGFS